MIRLLRDLIIALALLVALVAPARAACGGIPNVFVNNVSTIDATTTNANNNSLLSCVTNVDWTQIGTAGLYPSQLKPTTPTQATFGGTPAYTFNNGLNVNGAGGLSVAGLAYFSGNAQVLGQLSVGTNFYVGIAPQGGIYQPSGIGLSAAPHMVLGTISVPATTATYVSLSGSAAFTSQSSYACSMMSTLGNEGPTAVVWAAASNSVGFYQNSGSTWTYSYLCVGY